MEPSKWCLILWLGSRLGELSMADDTGLAPKESVIETLCSWPDGLAVGGFVFLPVSLSDSGG